MSNVQTKQFNTKIAHNDNYIIQIIEEKGCVRKVL